MPQVEFEPTFPVFEREKTVHALARAATQIGMIDESWTAKNVEGRSLGLNAVVLFDWLDWLRM
jgi:hypothetical protein